MSIIKHAHKLKRHIYKNKERVFFCASPDNCTFKLNCKMTLGKAAECWRCGKTFIMNEVNIRQDKPHCVDCTKHKDDDKKKEVSIKIEIPTRSLINERGNLHDPLGVKGLEEQLRKSIKNSLRDNAADDKGVPEITDDDDML